AKAERAAGRALPAGGRAFVTVRDADKTAVLPIARALARLGFALSATAGTAAAPRADGVDGQDGEKGAAGVGPLRRRRFDLVVNTPAGGNARRDGYAIREAAVVTRIPCITTLAGARAAVEAIEKARTETALSLQERHEAAEEVAWRAAS